MSDQTDQKPGSGVETATARDILAKLFPEHAWPEQDHRDVVVRHIQNIKLDVAGPPIVQLHGVTDVDQINESGAVIACCCGELLPFGPEECAAVGWSSSDAVKRLKALGKIGLSRVGKPEVEA